MRGALTTVLMAGLVLGVTASAFAQVGLPNTFVMPPPTVSPFGAAQHPYNNPHPMLPNAGLGYARRGAPPSMGRVVGQRWVPEQRLAVQQYVVGPGSLPGFFVPREFTVPGYWVTDTTTGVMVPQRWVLDEVASGMFIWRWAQAEFRLR